MHFNTILTQFYLIYWLSTTYVKTEVKTDSTEIKVDTLKVDTLK